ncbi:phenylacetate--CoA ligase family protein [Sinomonas sp. R1AF57]|uniref:phenylacetate--CoA ligase family protein n=1 Tax=Sinomonas sp. R1AF57 TaxID=2020377 RepID=UPI000B605D85|nr:phenylacetate--CoA ligase family protein [Sinomonas sp. R1AF57]ASN51310.1 adenylate-forming protein [Sinomonas sp. R1AF57]
MDAALMARVLALRFLWRARDRWSAERIAAHRERAVAAARRHAVERSPFYRRLHAGLEDAPLTALPPVTKAQLMEHWDDAVTRPGLRLADVEAHLADLVEHDGDPGRPWRGRWWAAATAGTTGRRGVFIWDRREWATALASYSRPNDWAGIKAGPLHPPRIAFVSSARPTHASALLGATLGAVTPTLRLDAGAPLAETVAALNGFAPDIVVAYASALRPLAAEQAAGKLRISPSQITSSSEVLSAQTARDVERAWGIRPLDSYAATETAAIASVCTAGRRHLYEDLVIAESVDARNRPVPPGTPGEKLLVTVPFARTLPLIRYEMSDRLVIDRPGCPCGRAFAIVTRVDGRAEDVLEVPRVHGAVSVHPIVFEDALEDLPTTGWQVVQRRDGIDVLLVGLPPGTETDAVRARVEAALAAAGAAGVQVRVVPVAALERTALGKVPLVRGLPRA